MNKTGRGKFGLALYLHRVGFHWSEKRQAYIRLLCLAPEVVNISLVPQTAVFYKDSRHGRNVLHYMWWDKGTEKGDELLDMVPAIKHVRRVHVPISFNVNAETGERL